MAQELPLAQQRVETAPSDIWAAAKAGDVDAIKQLCRDGADAEKQDERGITPMSWAAMHGHASAVRALIQERAYMDRKNADGATPLMGAAFFGRPGVAMILIKRGASLKGADNNGKTLMDMLETDWEVTQRIAKDLNIEVERERIQAGREKTYELVSQKSDKLDPMHAFNLLIIGLCAVAIIVVAIIWMVIYFEKNRTAKMKVVATKIGLEFLGTQDDELLARMQVFSLFNKGHARKVKNVMRAEAEITTLSIFDYHYNTGGEYSNTHLYTVVAMESDSLRLPEFTLRPEGFFDRVGAVLGGQDIDFDHNPEFSESFVLQGESEEAIRQFFDTELLLFFTQRKGIYIESAPGVFIYLRGGRRKPKQIREIMDEAYAAFAAFTARLSR